MRLVLVPILAFAANTLVAQGGGVGLQPIGPGDPLAARRPDYRMLLRALARYRLLAADTTIPEFPAPPTLPVRAGDSLATIAELRARLIALGDLSPSANPDASGRYAEPVIGGVRSFQSRHGLDPDGIIGPATLAQLQAPLASRVRDIEQSLERIRAEPPVDSGPYVVVNVPAFRLLAFNGPTEDSVPALSMKVIVGRATRTPTPTLAVSLGYLDFWPDWNVPWSIVVNEIIPILRRDSLYLRRQDMELLGRGDVALGDTVTPSVIESLHSGALRLRQRSGPANPLGRVKFVIPNLANIFLHDTPGAELFSKTRRDFSHGCIRVEDARSLAIWVMRPDPAWGADSIDAAMVGPASRRVPLPRPIRVIVEYNTAMATAEGRVWFPPDIYGLGNEPPKR